MRCAYPNCRALAVKVPVIALPTMRTAGEGAEARFVETSKPTFIMSPELCQTHCNNYILSDWMDRSSWAAIQEAARTRGLIVPEMNVVAIEFKPLGWEPNRYLELKRD